MKQNIFFFLLLILSLNTFAGAGGSHGGKDKDRPSKEPRDKSGK